MAAFSTSQDPLDAFRLPTPPLLLTSSLYGSTLQLSEIAGGPNHGLSAVPPPTESYMVTMRMIDCFDADIFADGRYVSSARDGRAGMLGVQDLACSICADLKDPFDLMFLHISRSALSECAYEMGYYSTGELQLGMGRFMDDPVARNLFLAVRPALTSPLGRNRLFVDYALGALTVHLVQRYTAITDRKKKVVPRLANWQVARAREIINGSLGDDLPLSAVASALGLSVRQLSRAFVGSFGMPPHRYLMSCRVRKARALLMDSRYSLADVGAASGFANQSHFSRVFKTLTGLNPGEWRRLHGVRAKEVP